MDHEEYTAAKYGTPSEAIGPDVIAGAIADGWIQSLAGLDEVSPSQANADLFMYDQDMAVFAPGKSSHLFGAWTSIINQEIEHLVRGTANQETWRQCILGFFLHYGAMADLLRSRLREHLVSQFSQCAPEHLAVLGFDKRPMVAEIAVVVLELQRQSESS